VNGGWVWNLKGVRLVLFRLAELTKRAGETVFLCEGEKDVLALEAIGFLSTCNPMGAGKWKDSYAEALRGQRVVVVTDNDPARDERSKLHFKGQQHAGQVAESLLRHNCEVRIIEPPRGKDASDWLAAGGNIDEINALVSETAALSLEILEAWRRRWLVSESPAREVDPVTEWATPLELQSELPPAQRF
jgi:DNA primase